MLDGMKAARDALAEYYRDEAPVMVMIDAAIAEAEEYNRAYELLFKEHGKLRAEAEGVRALTAQQAEDDGLWFEAKTAPEAYLQAALRRLHAVIETPNV